MKNINMMNNSAYNIMSSNNSLMNLNSFAANSNNSSYLQQTEKSLLADRLNSELMYKMSEAQLKALKKAEKEDIKRSFSTFA